MNRGLGELESTIMDRMWSYRRPASVREVLEDLRAEREIAYTTVMTVLQRLAKKRLALEAREGRAYLYRATSSSSAVTADLMREALNSAGAADRTAALTRFVEVASPTEVAILRRALDSRRL